MQMETGQATVLEMKKENVKEMAQLLKTVNFKEFGTLHPFENGLKITVDDGACQQANAFLDSSYFSSLKVREESISLKVPIKTIFDFLNIPESSSSSAKFSYAGMFEPLKIIIEEEDGYVLRAKINTAIADQELDFEFDDAHVLATVMIKTQVLKDIFKDFDETSRSVSIQFTKAAINFTTVGEVGEITASIPSKSLQIETIKCSEEVSFNYSLNLLQRMNASFTIATKVIFRVDSRGVLCCQFTIDHGENRQSYVEFLTVPCEDFE